jgi:triphosphoribosyl-dephospho-CoA synthetase
MTTAAALQAHPSSSPVDVGRAAVRALHAELTLHPKPGLVSPVDRGARDDMDAATFQRSLRRSLLALRCRERAVAVHRECVASWLSPGGAADVLAAALFVHELSA